MSVNGFRLRWVPVIAAVLVAVVVATGQPAAAGLSRTYGYEHGFSGWQLGYAGDGDWTMDRSTEVAYAGRYSVQCYLDGTAGPATAWLAHRYQAPMDTLVTVTLTFQLWSQQASDVNQWPVVAYVGTTPPTRESAFQVVGYTDQTAGWQRYRIELLQLTGQAPATIWVAFGISAVWEYEREYYMDHVTVRLVP